MLPVETQLEILEHLPAGPTRKPPLLFVHGGYCDAWCWEPYFLPWFAARGYPSYALSLRGHGGSGGGSTLFAVWNLATADEDARKGIYSPWRDLRGAFGAPGTNTFAIKLSYWFAP